MLHILILSLRQILSYTCRPNTHKYINFLVHTCAYIGYELNDAFHTVLYRLVLWCHLNVTKSFYVASFRNIYRRNVCELIKFDNKDLCGLNAVFKKFSKSTIFMYHYKGWTDGVRDDKFQMESSLVEITLVEQL